MRGIFEKKFLFSIRKQKEKTHIKIRSAVTTNGCAFVVWTAKDARRRLKIIKICTENKEKHGLVCRIL
jgi:hypothetical protein